MDQESRSSQGAEGPAGNRGKEGNSVITRDRVDAVIFDMDGVITDTARAHASAWKRLFHTYRKERIERGHKGYAPFEGDDYRKHLDGKPRYDGVRDFLASRGIELPPGNPDDDPGEETICGLGNRKNLFFQEWLQKEEVPVFEDAIAFIRSLRTAGIKTAVISSSKNCRAVLENAGVADLFDVRVDGKDMARLNLPGKPDPAIFHRAAECLAASPDRVAVVEDALAGVRAGARGHFLLVIGVDRSGVDLKETLRSHGADLVVDDLRRLLGTDFGRGSRDGSKNKPAP